MVKTSKSKTYHSPQPRTLLVLKQKYLSPTKRKDIGYNANENVREDGLEGINTTMSIILKD